MLVSFNFVFNGCVWVRVMDLIVASFQSKISDEQFPLVTYSHFVYLVLYTYKYKFVHWNFTPLHLKNIWKSWSYAPIFTKNLMLFCCIYEVLFFILKQIWRYLRNLRKGSKDTLRSLNEFSIFLLCYIKLGKLYRLRNEILRSFVALLSKTGNDFSSIRLLQKEKWAEFDKEDRSQLNSWMSDMHGLHMMVTWFVWKKSICCYRIPHKE